MFLLRLEEIDSWTFLGDLCSIEPERDTSLGGHDLVDYWVFLLRGSGSNAFASFIPCCTPACARLSAQNFGSSSLKATLILASTKLARHLVHWIVLLIRSLSTQPPAAVSLGEYLMSFLVNFGNPGNLHVT